MNKKTKYKYAQIIKNNPAKNYILESIFQDIHEYEAYFEFFNIASIGKITPNELQITFDLNIKNLALRFSDNERLITLAIPITKSQNNLRSKTKLTKRYIDEFGDLIPKIRLSIQSQIAAYGKVIGPDAKIKLILDRSAKRKRTAAIKKAKNM